jgi:hypothetical protein
METSRPVIYNITNNGSQLQFCIGGYAANGATVEVSTNLAGWQAVQTFAASANQLIFTTPINPKAPSFFRVQ